MGRPITKKGFTQNGAGCLGVGHWTNPNCYIRLGEVASIVENQLVDKLVAQGKPAFFWEPVAATDTGVVPCSCVKDTTDSGDRACLSCFGVQFAPGFRKFLHKEQFWCSSEIGSFTLTNTAILTTKKVNVIQIATGATSGTIVTQDKAYTANPNAEPWSIEVDWYQRATGNAMTAEYSLNGGGSWTPVTLIEDNTRGYGWSGTILAAALNPAGGNIRWRFTLSRSAAGDITPVFEILRMRRVASENENDMIRSQRDDLPHGAILLLRPWTVEQNQLEAGRGRLILHANSQSWTASLHQFDTSLTANTPACRIKDELGSHPFYEWTGGVQQATRYAITQVSISESLGSLSHQYFTDRRIQDLESYSKVW